MLRESSGSRGPGIIATALKGASLPSLLALFLTRRAERGFHGLVEVPEVAREIVAQLRVRQPEGQHRLEVAELGAAVVARPGKMEGKHRFVPQQPGQGIRQADLPGRECAQHFQMLEQGRRKDEPAPDAERGPGQFIISMRPVPFAGGRRSPSATRGKIAFCGRITGCILL